MSTRSGLFVTGTDTEIGKTVVTAALAHAFTRRGMRVGVMKPVASGCFRKNGELVSQDAVLLAKASRTTDPLSSVCPYRFEPPVAPAAALNGIQEISLEKIRKKFEESARRHDIVLVEGIGGLLVPLDREKTVLDMAKALRLPVLVVARAGLGTINHTLLTLQTARAAGLEVIGVVLNGFSARPGLAEKTNPRIIHSFGRVPIVGRIPRLPSPEPGRVARYLQVEKIARRLKTGNPLSNRDAARISRLDRKRIWHPFTQMREWEREEPLIVQSAQGVYVTDTRGNRYLDGVSSLWVNLHGHNRPELNRAIRDQLEKAAHTTLLGCGNVPSAELADALVAIAPKGLTRVFYSDNGSTAVEIALKMAFQFCQQNGFPRRKKFVHFVNAYHGDTVGSVSVGGIDLFHKVYGPLLFKGFKLPAPYPYRGVSAADSLNGLERTLRRHHTEIAAVIVEPLVQGAAGMIVQPAGWLKKVERLCRRYGVFLIADEVAVGFGRTGTIFACEQEGVSPDFLCLAKGLTAGYLPLAATLTTEKVYKGFLGPYSSFRTFFHGHSYTGNQLGCAVALENLKIFRRERTIRRIQPKIRLLAQELKRFTDHPHVGEIRQRGLMAGIELVADKKSRKPYPLEERVGIRVCRLLRDRGILLRPLGNVIVILPPLAIFAGQIRFLCRQTLAAIDQVTQ
ncbi:MAG: adenosylmethionine--8-amino-7-oxononanoate transaminase [Candidatus Omnitrophica bacterium]|nr:adenosylmethionine--8-amino-7-oxononanoate transaminase [Candidatus Omnitrophota bacterium]